MDKNKQENKEQQFCPHCGEQLTDEEVHTMVVEGLCPICGSKGAEIEVTNESHIS